MNLIKEVHKNINDRHAKLILELLVLNT